MNEYDIYYLPAILGSLHISSWVIKVIYIYPLSTLEEPSLFYVHASTANRTDDNAMFVRSETCICESG